MQFILGTSNFGTSSNFGQIWKLGDKISFCFTTNYYLINLTSNNYLICLTNLYYHGYFCRCKTFSVINSDLGIKSK